MNLRVEFMGCDIGHKAFRRRAISIQQSAFSPGSDSPGMKDFRDLVVWQKAHLLTLASYRATDAFPKAETYGLTIQIRRCSASIAANIAEGCGKRGNGEFQRFLNIACGSASELEYHFLLARDLAFLSATDYQKLNHGVVEVKRMLASLARKVEAERFAS